MVLTRKGTRTGLEIRSSDPLLHTERSERQTSRKRTRELTSNKKAESFAKKNLSAKRSRLNETSSPKNTAANEPAITNAIKATNTIIKEVHTDVQTPCAIQYSPGTNMQPNTSLRNLERASSTMVHVNETCEGAAAEQGTDEQEMHAGNSTASEGFRFHDMAGKERVFGAHFKDFIVPFPQSTAPETLVHFISLYIIRNESRRTFPREVQLSWLTDFCISHWIKQKDEDRQIAEHCSPTLPFSEHDGHELSRFVKKQFLLFPFLADNRYSLVAFENIGELVKILEELLRLESGLSKSSREGLKNLTLLDRIKRFKGLLTERDIKSTAIYHLDWNREKHEKYRPRFHDWLVELCFAVVRDLNLSCSEESVQKLVKEFVGFNIPEIPDPPKEKSDTAWKVVEYLLVMLHEPEMDPTTGKIASSERAQLLQGCLKRSRYDDIPGLRNIARQAIANMHTAKKNPRIDPYPGLWGTVRGSLLRDVDEPLEINSKVILRNCLPVVLEFALKALDDYIELHQKEFKTYIKTKAEEKECGEPTLEGFEKNTSLQFAISREWASKKLVPIFEEFVLVERHGLKPRERNARFWRSVFDHASSFPQYRDSAHIFRAMRIFPDSISVCLGLDYLHAKEHRIFFHQATPPNLRHGERPWKLFDYSSRNLNRLSHWYERCAWGRMHEAGVIVFAVTEFIFRCATNSEVKTDAELSVLFRGIHLQHEEHTTSVLKCPVNLHDIVNHVRSKKESVEQYKLRITKRLTEAAEATKLAITCASNAFRKALIPFACAYSVRRGVPGLNVSLCKLLIIPDNMLDDLWQNVTDMLKEMLKQRAKKGQFSFSGSKNVLQYEVEAQLTRLFRVMNTVFMNTAETLMKDVFSESQEKLKRDIATYASQLGAGNGKKIQKLRSLPSESLWNFVESRYSVGYLHSLMAGPSVANTSVGRFRRPHETSATKDSDLSQLDVLSAEGISSLSTIGSKWEDLKLTPLLDPSLAMQTEPIFCVNPSKTNFGWSLITALGAILQRIPGHVQSGACFTASHTFCTQTPSTLSACLEILSTVAENVGKTWSLGFGVLSLQTQSVFVRFDALVSAAVAIVGLKEYGCRPSIDANLCEIDDERRAGNDINEETAFMGCPREVQLFNHPDYCDGFKPTKWRGVLIDADIRNLVFAEQAAEVEPDRANAVAISAESRKRKMQSVDFLHLRAFNLPQPQVHKVLLRYFLEVPGAQAERFQDRNGELNLQVGDVFWLSMISVGRADKNGFVGGNGYSGSHLGVMMEPAVTVFHRQELSLDRRVSIQKDQMAAVIFLPQEGNQHERNGFADLLNKMLGKTLCDSPSRSGNQVIRLIPTGVNISSEINTSHVTFRRTKLIPRAINLAAIHPRLVQIHTQKLLTIIHRSSSRSDRRNGIIPSLTMLAKYEHMRKDISKVVEGIFPRLEPEQLQAISVPLLWSSLVHSSFFDFAGNPLHEMQSIFSQHFSDHSMKHVGTNVFFIRGPPGTGKSSVITSLIFAALFGHEREEDVKGLLPKSIKRVLVVTHTNAAVDDVLKKVSRMHKFKDDELVRVGLHGKNTRFSVQEVFNRMVRREQKSQNVRNPRRGFPEFGWSDIVDAGSIVFSTLGSLQRREFTESHKRFDMVLVEEAGKLHEGDINLVVAKAIGLKDAPEPGHPLAVVLVGDELQLPPHSNLDPNIATPRLCDDSFFMRYVSKCEKVPGEIDFNYPTTLVTQHRAHRAIANVFSHFAYKGIIRTGARDSLFKWNEDDMDRRIEESEFKFRPVSVVSYNGCLHSDVPGNISTLGGNTNKCEYMLILNIYKDWCYRSRKFDNRITIISPYKAQAEKIRLLLAQEGKSKALKGLSTIQVYTVDSSQGLENDIVILSLVRTRSSEKQAFLDNPYRINTMLSRARERLIVVGARKQLRAFSASWKRCYDIIDALAIQEKHKPEDNFKTKERGDSNVAHTLADDRERERLNYGFHEIVNESEDIWTIANIGNE